MCDAGWKSIKRCKLSPEERLRLAAMIEDEPYCYLAEYACKISIELGKNVCVATVHYYMKRDLNLTRKKVL